MAQLWIILRRDPQSGKQNIVVKLDSDSDALPMEHETLHRVLVEKLLGQGIDAEDLGELVIEREGQRDGTPTPTETAPAERDTQAQGRSS
jgi:hypothetical protein